MNGMLTKMDYPQTAGVLEPPEVASIKVRLQRSKDHHERELAKINAAMAALDSQPEVAQLLEAVMKAL